MIFHLYLGFFIDHLYFQSRSQINIEQQCTSDCVENISLMNSMFFVHRALWRTKYKAARRKSERCRSSKTKTSAESQEPFASHVFRYFLDFISFIMLESKDFDMIEMIKTHQNKNLHFFLCSECLPWRQTLEQVRFWGRNALPLCEGGTLAIITILTYNL